jgi:hypothetical protein
VDERPNYRSALPVLLLGAPGGLFVLLYVLLTPGEVSVGSGWRRPLEIPFFIAGALSVPCLALYLWAFFHRFRDSTADLKTMWIGGLCAAGLGCALYLYMMFRPGW